MAPPELTRDGPVTKVFEPCRVDLFMWNFGIKMRQILFTHQAECEVAKLVHFYEPLLGQHRLDDSLASLAMRQRDVIILDLFEKTKLFELFNDFCTSFKTI